MLSCNQESARLIAEERFIEAARVLSPLVNTFNSFTSPSFHEVVALNNLAFVYSKLGQMEHSLKYLAKAAAFSPTSPSETLVKIGTHLNLAVTNSLLGFYKTAKKEAYNTLKFLEDLPNSEASAVVYYNMGVMWLALKKQKKASRSFHLALGIAEHELGKEHAFTRLLTTTCAEHVCQAKGQNGMKISSCSSKNIARTEKNIGKVLINRKISPEKVKKNYFYQKQERSHTGSAINIHIDTSKFAAKALSNSIGPIGIDLKNNLNFDTKLKTPKTLKKKFLKNVISSRASVKEIADDEKKEDRVEGRVKNISQYLLLLQSELNNFSSNSKAIMKTAMLETPLESLESSRDFRIKESKTVKKNIRDRVLAHKST